MTVLVWVGAGNRIEQSNIIFIYYKISVYCSTKEFMICQLVSPRY